MKCYMVSAVLLSIEYVFGYVFVEIKQGHPTTVVYKMSV